MWRSSITVDMSATCEPVRIAPCVFALDISGTPAVFEIVAVFLAHEAISYAGEIDPGMGKMMDEERPGIKKLVIVDVLPLIGRGPRPEAVVRQGVCRRRQAQNKKNDRFVIAIPAIVQKAALRLPSLPRGRCAAAGPLPIDAAVDRIGAFANLVFAWRVLAEILARSQHPREQQRGVDQRHLRLPDPLAGLHVEEVVIEALIAGRVRLFALSAVPEETQGDECARPHPRAPSNRAPLRPDNTTARTQRRRCWQARPRGSYRPPGRSRD